MIHDAFFSHSHSYKQMVEDIAIYMEDEYTLKIWLDRWKLIPGERWIPEIEKSLNESKSCIVFLGEKNSMGWFQSEVEVALNIQSKKSEYMIFERDNKWYRVNVDPIFDDDGNVIRAVHVVSDITQKHTLETQLKENTSLLNFTQELTKVGGWKYSIQEKKMFWTNEMYLLHDIDLNEIEYGSSKHIDEGIMCYDEEDRPKILEAFEKCCSQGIPYDMIFPFTTFKNKRIWIRTSAQAIRSDGKITSVIGNLMDITTTKNSEIELSQYRNHLEELVKERTEKLEKQNAELEHFNELFVNREFRIKELKDRIKKLEGKK